jgi:hypothetical protein
MENSVVLILKLCGSLCNLSPKTIYYPNLQKKMASASTRHLSQSPQKGFKVYEHRHQKLRLLIQQKLEPYKRLFSSKSLEHFS